MSTRRFSDDVVDDMRRRHAEGASIADIAREQGAPYQSTYSAIKGPRCFHPADLEDSVKLAEVLWSLAERIPPGETFVMSVCPHRTQFGWMALDPCATCADENRTPVEIARISTWNGSSDEIQVKAKRERLPR